MPRDLSSLAGISEIGEPIVNESTCPSPLTRAWPSEEFNSRLSEKKPRLSVLHILKLTDGHTVQPSQSLISRIRMWRPRERFLFSILFLATLKQPRALPCSQTLKSPSSRPTAEEICGVTPPSSGQSSKMQHHRPCRASYTSRRFNKSFSRGWQPWRSNSPRFNQ